MQIEQIDALVRQLRKQAHEYSEASRMMAEAKSLRQADNPERRTDLYAFQSPEGTVQWKAADLIEQQAAQIASLSARPADNVVKALQQALVNHNDVLRSAYQIAARQGNSTDWDGFTKRAGSVLHFHHDEVNAARAAIAAMGGE